jgi:hypothetical protein
MPDNGQQANGELVKFDVFLRAGSTLLSYKVKDYD